MSKGYSDYFPVISHSSAASGARPDAFASPDAAYPRPEELDRPLAEKLVILDQILAGRIHGLSFSPYLDGQQPGCEIGAAQIRDRLEIIRPYCHWIRTFSCTEGNEQTPRLTREMGLRSMVGICLGEDREKNEIEFARGIEVAEAGCADILAVGNEVLLRGDMDEAALLGYLQRAKRAVPGVTVGYVDAYFLFENHPRLAEFSDVILINCYPFWESCPLEYAPAYMQEMHRRAVAVSRGKPVVISETGWPSAGEAYGAAVPGIENAVDYFIATYRWAEAAGVEVFYFSSFDERWKTGGEGDAGAYWGLWDKDGKRKFT